MEPGGPVAPMGDPAPPAIQSKAGDKAAFGYAPERWPSARMMSEAATENQFRMLKKKAEDRHLTERETGVVRDAVVAAYGLAEDSSKGALSLVIDFLISASPAALDAARGVRKKKAA